MRVTPFLPSQALWNANSKVLAQELALYKGENGDRMQRLERSNVSVVITLRGLQRSVDALATKEGVRGLEHRRRCVRSSTTVDVCRTYQVFFSGLA